MPQRAMRPLLLARLPRLLSQHVRKLVGVRVQLARPVRDAELRFDAVRTQVFADAVASRDQTLLFAPCSREELRHWFVACEGHDDDVVQLLGDSANNRTGAAKFSADGHWMATCGFGTSIKLWDVAATPVRKQREFEGNISWPNAFAISPDGQIVAAGLGSTRSEITVLDSSSRKTVATLGVGDTQHGNFVAIAFNSKDPGMLAASTLDGNIFVWEDWRKNSLPSTKLESARGTAFQIAFSRDGGYLYQVSLIRTCGPNLAFRWT